MLPDSARIFTKMSPDEELGTLGQRFMNFIHKIPFLNDLSYILNN